jgi:hypothetical protein
LKKTALQTQVSTLIQTLVNEWGASPSEINNGRCEDFMWAVLDRLDQANGHHKGVEERSTPNDKLSNHFWIECGGLHFDAECPEGVTSWKKLPVFQRCFGKR